MTLRMLVALVMAIALSAGSILQPTARVGAAPTAPSPAAPSITLVPVLSGLSSPLFVTNAHDGSNRLFVVEQGGIIKVLAPGQGAPSVFLDISARVVSGDEQGLLGLTFHPRYALNGRFFVDYTRISDGATVIAEYHVSAADPNVADPTETVLLVIPQPYSNHNGGMVEFGHDGFLYIGMGDGGSENDPENRGQNLGELLGKILRIDVDTPDPAHGTLYSSPPTNPFYGATPGRDEIYAYGIRNPWRFSFDRLTGQLYAGDVGQDAIEEIDIIGSGGNYGWRIWEGTRCTQLDPGLCNQAGFVFPITQYGHVNGRCAVMGGYVYRGTRSSLAAGTYVYGDYCTGEIFSLVGGTATVALATGLSFSLASFGEDEAGEIYAVYLGGSVYRIAAAGPCTVDLKSTSRSVGAAGAPAVFVGVTAPGGCAWNASSNDPWITVTAGQSGTGNGVVEFSIAANTGGAARTGTLTIGDQTFTVTQAGARCAASIKPLFTVFGPAGGTGAVAATIADGCAWTAVSNETWITITSGGGGTGSGNVTFSVDRNSGFFRVGTVTIGGRTAFVLSF